MKTKTYILTLSTRFPKGHPREGEETEFADRARRGLHYAEHPGYDSPLPSKIHTIRANYGLWKKRIDEVNAGRAVLSVRQWLGAPRRSKQRELFRLDRDSGIGVERVDLSNIFKSDLIPVYDEKGRMTEITCREAAENDGLDLRDWTWWFSNPRYDRTQPMAVIHFTSFRYCK